jgi:uncharacterized protein
MTDFTAPDPLLSPYASPTAEAHVLDVPVKAELVAAKKPRVWTVFLAFVAALVGVIAGAIVMAIGMLVWLMQDGRSVPEAADGVLDKITDPPLFLLAAAISQLAVGIAAIVPALLSPEGFRRRVGFVAPAVNPGSFIVLVLSVYFPTAIGLALAHWLVKYLPADETVAQMYAKLTWTWAVPFVLFIAFAPGFFEEMLFRGYIQRRLERRWGPAVAITIASLMFALMHITPQVVVFAFPVGLWFGFIAWRTGSIWPTVAAHALVNGTWNVFNLSMKFEVIPEVSTPATLFGMATLGLCFFAPSCWILYAVKKEELAS